MVGEAGGGAAARGGVMRRSWRNRFALAGVLLFGLVSAAQPAPRRPISSPDPALRQAMAALFGARRFAQAVISPDGRYVAWVEVLPASRGSIQSHSAIYVIDRKAPGAARRISAGDGKAPHAEGDLAWSPDSRLLAFLSDAARPGQLQLYVASVAGGAARRLTRLKGFLSSPAWSPDGKTIALLFIENAPGAAGPLAAVAPPEGVVESKIFEQRLTLVDVSTGSTRAISPPDLYVYEFDWSPDSRRLAGTAARGNGDDNWYVAELYIFDRSGKAKSILKPGMQIGFPRWSPDGRTIAFIGGLMSDEPIVGGDVYAVPAAGGAARNLTEGMKATATSVVWLGDSRTVLFAEFVNGETGIAAVGVSGGVPRTLWSAAETIAAGEFVPGFSLARDEKTSAVILESFDRPPEVWAGPLGEWKQVSHRNAGIRRAWGPSKSLAWTSDAGTVQGWLTYPRDYDPGWRYPLVVRVHGGPAWAVTPSWPGPWTYYFALPAEGTFLLQANPRGSLGRGEAFTRANVKDFGGGDFRDILAGVDAAVAAAPIDPRRVGITGWSYGGYMTMWAVTQTQRFAAAVAGAGLANWESYYGENAIDQWMIPYFGASVYDDPGVYAKSSPIRFIKNARTPTLVVVGAEDGECPAPQSFEFWHALETLGVKTQLVVYPNEGHEFSQPAHLRDVVERTVEWFDEFLKQPRNEAARRR
jgi:dipeptidyl aminopeptidase/acylaminoacyl peptidase